MVVTKDYGEERINRYRVSVEEGESILEMNGRDGYTTMRILLHAKEHLEMIEMVNFMLCIFYYN